MAEWAELHRSTELIRPAMEIGEDIKHYEIEKANHESDHPDLATFTPEQRTVRLFELKCLIESKSKVREEELQQPRLLSQVMVASHDEFLLVDHACPESVKIIISPDTPDDELARVQADGAGKTPILAPK